MYSFLEDYESIKPIYQTRRENYRANTLGTHLSQLIGMVNSYGFTPNDLQVQPPQDENQGYTIDASNNIVFTGTVSSQTPSVGDNSTKIATTAYVTNALTGVVTLSNGATSNNRQTFTGFNQFNNTLNTFGISDNSSITTTGLLQGGSLTVSGNTTLSGNNNIAGYLTTSAAASTYAPLENPTFTGTVNVPTPSSGDNTTKLATTAYVTNAINSGVSLSSGTSSAPQTFTGYNQFNNILRTTGISDTLNISTSGLIQSSSLTISGNATLNGNVTLSGVSTAVTPVAGTYSNQLATTQFVINAIQSALNNNTIFRPTPTRTPTPLV